MRDILIAVLIFGSVPVAVFRPDFGILAYIWIGLMNPHRLSWRLEAAPVGLVVALGTLLGTVLRGEIRRIPMKSTTILLILWIAYTTLTTTTAISGRDAWIEWNRFSRIILMCFVALMLLQERRRLERYVWVAMASIAFFSVKGGLFSIATRGAYRVWGPMGSFIEGNNELALAEIMILPLMLYFLRRTKKAWQRWAYYVCFVLTIFSILFSYSRGAFVAFAGVAGVLMIRSRYRFQALIMVLVLGGLMVSFVPTEWKERMFSIEQYQTDQSAQGRINAWHFAVNIAKTHIFGGGFRTFTKELFMVYAPNPTDVHDAHSIYFEVLGEQGFPGLFIFLGILFTSLWKLERLRKRWPSDPSRRWVHDLAEMLQFSLLGYLFGGTFLGLAYFDLPYYVVVSTILLEHIAERQTAPVPAPAVETRPARPALGSAPAAG
jgi:probable O-glycosylation ligase (exosortase A-associated)